MNEVFQILMNVVAIAAVVVAMFVDVVVVEAVAVVVVAVVVAMFAVVAVLVVVDEIYGAYWMADLSYENSYFFAHL